MIRKIASCALVVALSVSMAITQYSTGKKTAVSLKNDTVDQSKAVVWTGTQGTTFDKGTNGYGWYQGYNRKIQTNLDPVTGTMVGSLYRQLHNVGSGVTGGMIGAWDASFQGYAQTLYDASPYTSGGLPGTRYPYASEFINGYFFGLFNDYDTAIGSTVSFPMFTVADATFGWDISFWSAPKRIEATEGGAHIPGAWTGIGDVVYDPVSGYYYWANNWIYDLTSIDGITSMVTGRSLTPGDPDSWEWTDYNELRFDAAADPGDLRQMDNFVVAYCKDTQGVGTGYGIAVSMFRDASHQLYTLGGDPVTMEDVCTLGYMYTTNWGADDSTGDFKSNWITPNNEGNNLFTADIFKLIDWYGTVLTGDSIGVDGEGNTIYEEIPFNAPKITWNISAVATEENYVHVLLKIFGGTTEDDNTGWYYLNDEKVVCGYYDVVGYISDSGVNWISANFIAHPMGVDNGEMEFKYTNNNDFSIGYAGHGAFYASWIDRPETRYTANPNSDPNKDWIDDVFVTYSADHGKTWDINKTVDYEGYDLNYAANITKTSNLQDEGFVVANHGVNEAGTITFYGVCQYYDPENPLPDPVVDWFDYQQFFKVWKIVGTGTGIETEDVTMMKDFSLFQNYPNPFNPVTEIRFSLQNDANVKLAVYNIKGELVSNLKNEKMAKGIHSVNFDASDLNSGVYFYKLNVNGRAETKKMVLTK